MLVSKICLSDLVTGLNCRAASVAKNLKVKTKIIQCNEARPADSRKLEVIMGSPTYQGTSFAVVLQKKKNQKKSLKKN